MILVALGSNRSGAWGSPEQTLKRAVKELAKAPGTRVLRRSKLYQTAGVGPGQPGIFVNSVVAIECHCGPAALLRRLKMIERIPGPRSTRRWGPRTLDLDILDYRRRISGWTGKGRVTHASIQGRVVLPHPLMHLRPFVLVPLVEIASDWRHPVLQLTARQLSRQMRNERGGRVLKPV